MVENGTMPASNHGLPTSRMREIGAPQEEQAILTASIHGRCGEWPANSGQPSTARACNSCSLPITSKRSQAPQVQIGSARPQ